MHKVSICLDTWISDAIDPTDLKTKKALFLVPFNHLQSRTTRYLGLALVFVWDGALRERANFYFQGVLS